MKFHWVDFLARDLGHWNFTENRERFAAYQRDLADLPTERPTIVTINRDTLNWDQLSRLDFIEELTVHEPTAKQLKALELPKNLKRFRMTHARPNSIDFIEDAANLEEVILEYVSKFTDLGPIARLPKLRALHLENLRSVTGFSCLDHCTQLKNLAILGTFDWRQPIDSLAFLNQITALEHLSLVLVKYNRERALSDELETRPGLLSLSIGDNDFTLDDFAWLEAATPNVETGRNELYTLMQWDIENVMPLGRGERRYPYVNKENAAPKIAAHAERYELALSKARIALNPK